jgi:hypothetical protein
MALAHMLAKSITQPHPTARQLGNVMWPCDREERRWIWSGTYQSLPSKSSVSHSDCFLWGHFCCVLGASVLKHWVDGTIYIILLSLWTNPREGQPRLTASSSLKSWHHCLPTFTSCCSSLSPQRGEWQSHSPQRVAVKNKWNKPCKSCRPVWGT